mmetsp:Transcript_41766/g.69770  ORF Transcript_41766/g.69770 Transcript_41766/m.69770 type:complete len:89 (-) Transcript_41766:554-820(-)
MCVCLYARTFFTYFTSPSSNLEALFTRLLKRASFLGHMPSSIEQGHRHVDKIINETKMNPSKYRRKSMMTLIDLRRAIESRIHNLIPK